MATNDLRLGWAIGLFEGEGCISHNARTDLWALIVVSTDEDVVRSVHAAFGRGTVAGPYQRGTHKPFWRWQAAARDDVAEILTTILPHLHARRAERARQALASIAARPKGKYRLPRRKAA